MPTNGFPFAIRVSCHEDSCGFSGSFSQSINILFLAVTGGIAVHGIRFRNEEGETDWVRLLFGCIAATFFFLVLFQDVLGVMQFG